MVWDDEVQGLGVRILPPMRGKPSRKDFIVTWKVGLKSRTMAIGTYGVDCTLRQARRIARQAIDLARRGRDPIQERQLALGIGTTEDLASRFLFEHNAAKKKPAAPVAPESESPEQPAAETAAVETPVAPADGAAAVDAQPQVDPVTSGSPDPAVAVVVQQAPADAPSESPATVPPATAPAAPAPSADSATAADQVAGAASGQETAEAAPTIGSSPNRLAPAAADQQPTAAEQPTGEEGAGSEAASSPVVAPAPDPAPRPLAADAARRAHDAQAAASRSAARMRMMALPAALHRDIEQRARALGLTMTAYLQALVDLESAAAEKTNGGGATAPAAPMTRAEEIFSKVQARQGADAPAALPDTSGGD